MQNVLTPNVFAPLCLRFWRFRLDLLHLLLRGHGHHGPYGDFASSVLRDARVGRVLVEAEGVAVCRPGIRSHMPVVSCSEAGVEAVGTLNVLVHARLTTDNVHALRVAFPFPKLCEVAYTRGRKGRRRIEAEPRT